MLKRESNQWKKLFSGDLFKVKFKKVIYNTFEIIFHFELIIPAEHQRKAIIIDTLLLGGQALMLLECQFLSSSYVVK